MVKDMKEGLGKVSMLCAAYFCTAPILLAWEEFYADFAQYVQFRHAYQA